MAIKSILGFVKTLKKSPRDNNYEYFYRGHADLSYTLLPSIYRKSSEGRCFIDNENNIFREIIIRTPGDFIHEGTAMEKLVKMQHYGLPTRILDITSNPLVALYFACCDHPKTNGEVLVFKIPKKEIKYFDSDTVSILANLAKRPLSFDLSDAFRQSQHPEFTHYLPLPYDSVIDWFNQQGQIPYLLHKIREEKPYFLPIIDPNDLDRVLAVRVKLNNSRIVKQAPFFCLAYMKKGRSCNAAKRMDSK